MRSLGFWAIVLAVVPLLGGCGFLAGAAVVGAGVYYVRGEASKLYAKSVPEVYQAAVEVLEELDVITTEKMKSDAEARIKGRTAGSDPLDMKIVRKGGEVCEVKLRVGIMGNRDYSNLILSRLDRKLGL